MIQEINNFFWLIILFFGCWFFFAGLVHEMFHALACVLQGGKYDIEIWFYKLKIGKKEIPIPSMRIFYKEGITNLTVIDYSGGLLNSVLCVVSSLVFYFTYQPLFIILFSIGLAQFFYGLFEGYFIRKISFDTYMKYHYYVYIVGIFVGVLLTRHEIWNYIISC